MSPARLVLLLVVVAISALTPLNVVQARQGLLPWSFHSGGGTPPPSGPATIVNTTADLSVSGAQVVAGNYDIARNEMGTMGQGGQIQVGNCNGDSTGCMFYWYSAQAWGSAPNNTLTVCPAMATSCESVWSSPDMGANNDWTYRGLILAAVPQTIGGFPAPLLRSDGSVVIWFGYSGPDNNHIGVLTCSTPAGGATPTVPGNCVAQTPATTQHVCTGQASVGSVDIYEDPTTGNAYVDYNCPGAGGIWIDKLNSTRTDTVSTETSSSVFSSGAESASLYKDGSTFYLIAGPLCNNCIPGPQSIYASASTVAGLSGQAGTTFGPSTSCNGQPAVIARININGTPEPLYETTRWYPIEGGFGYSGSYLMGLGSNNFELLTFPSGVPSYSCTATVTIPGLSATPPSPIAADVTTENDFGQFKHWLDPYDSNPQPGPITSAAYPRWSFVATHSGTSVTITWSPSQYNSQCGDAGAPCPTNPLAGSSINVNLLNSSFSVLATQTLANSAIGFTPAVYTQTFTGVTITSGQTYWIEPVGTNSFPGYIYSYVDCSVALVGGVCPDAGAYPAGTFQFTQNTGSSWTTVSGRYPKFSETTNP